MTELLIINAKVASMQGDNGYGLIEKAAIFIKDEVIHWIGNHVQLPEELKLNDDHIIDAKGALITPGLIDCHTHLVYGGDRASEFELRLEGVSYEQIAGRGGGILSTVNHIRAASEQQLYQQSLPRLERLMSEGVTTIEIKSGYGLDCENEIKMLRVADTINKNHPIDVVKTFLAAHALPKEFNGDKAGYIKQVCDYYLPKAHGQGLIDHVDGFCEKIAFNVEQIGAVFDVARNYNLPIKLHAEQLSNLGGAVMAAKRGALSVDHIEYLDPQDVPILKQNNTVAVLLPGAFYTLKETKKPPIKALREHQVDMAVASDCNPGSSPVTSLLLCMNMACTFFSLTPSEALRGVTINAAKALGLEDKVGSLAVGKLADLVLWDTTNPAELSYHIGLNQCRRVMKRGRFRS